MTITNDIIEKIGTLLAAKDEGFDSQGFLLMEAMCQTPEEVRSILRSIDSESYDTNGCLSVIEKSQTLFDIIGLLAELGDDEILGLTKIKLNDADISSIPIGIKNLIHLKKLRLRTNNLTTLDCLPPNLEVLDVFNNSISTIPMSAEIQNLKYLNVMRNQISELPLALFEGGLKGLDFDERIVTLDWLLSLGPRTRAFIDAIAKKDSSTVQNIDTFLYALPNHKEFILSTIAQWHPGFETISIYNYWSHEGLPSWLQFVHHVKGIKLSGFKKSDLPQWFFQFTMLEKLEISSSNVNKIIEVLPKFTSMKHLSIEKCDLLSFPDQIQTLPHLETLILKNCQIEHIPEWIQNIKGLKHLDISKNQISVLPNFITKMTELETLIFSKNQITALPNELGNLINLRTLHMSENPIDRLPKSFSKLRHFETKKNRHIRPWSYDSQTITFPEGLWQNKEQTLDALSFPNVTISDCPGRSLSFLDVETKPIIDTLIGEDSAHITKRTPQMNELSGTLLFWVIVNIATWNAVFADSIEHLHIHRMGLLTLPPEIKYLRKLKTLTLKFSSIASLPDECGELSELTHLYLNSTKVSTLPESMSKMTKLKYLNLFRTRAGEWNRAKFQALLPDCRIAI